MLAPVSFVPNLGVVLAPGTQFFLSAGGLAMPKPQFGQKAKPKGRAQACETHRAGDWVCILCHNLNYSFRKVCNRCQVQTKRENLLQSLSMLGRRDDESQGDTPEKPAKRSTLDSPPGLDGEDADAEHDEQLRRTFDTPTHKPSLDALSTKPSSAQQESWTARRSPDSPQPRIFDFLASPAKPFRLFHADRPQPQQDPAIGGKPTRPARLAGLETGEQEDLSILRSVHSLLDEQ